MEFRILGTIDVRWGDRTLVVDGPKPRTLLAILARTPGRAVSLEHIVDGLWGEEPPAGTKAAVYTAISTLRRGLSGSGREVVTRCPGGYLLDVKPESVDLWLFEHRAAEGRKALRENRPEEAARHLGDALALWRGAALGGAAGEWADRERTRLAELRLAVTEDRFGAELALGRGPDLVDELGTLVAGHPLRERLRGQLMTALCQGGRHADAVACFQQGRQVLVEELGLEPGADLCELFEGVLQGRIGPFPRTTADAASGEPSAQTVQVVPSQLLSDIADFTGREREVGEAGLHLVSGGSAIYAVAGKPGAGKSALATFIAHRIAGHFPDGQLYVNLRGAEPVPVDPADVIGRFLRALGVADHRVPENPDERAALYRTVTANLSVLILLDNAADERQIRPLLPAGSRCAVIVTARRRLSALEGAEHVALDVLDEAKALELLGRVAGPSRVAAEPAVAREIVRLVGFLPLALRIVGARVAGRPDRSMEYLARRLREQHRLLNELTVGDLEVRGSLVVSYRGLRPRERTALRRLAWLGIPDFAAWVLAPLLEVTVDEAADLAEALVEAQVLDVVRVDGPVVTRYRLHELTSAFARECADAEEALPSMLEAVERVADCWQLLVEKAAGEVPTLDGTWIRSPELPTGTPLDEQIVATLLRDPAGWFDVEQTALVHTVERASELGLVAAATRLATTLCSSSFAVRNHFSPWWSTHSAALEAARRAGDRASQAVLLAGLGDLRYEQDRFDEAVAYYGKALEEYELAGDVRSKAATRLSLSKVLCEQGHLTASLAEVDDLLPGLHKLADPAVVARAHHTRARALTELGDIGGALGAGTTALEIFDRIGHWSGAAMTHRALGITHRAAGRLREAADHCELALAASHGVDAPLMRVYLQQALAKVRIRQGRGAEVRGWLQDGLVVCERMQDSFGQALLLRTLGELALAEGRLRDAETHLGRSVWWWEALDLPLWRARSQRDQACVFEAAGQQASADEAWAEAMAVFRRYGSREAGEPRPVSALAV